MKILIAEERNDGYETSLEISICNFIIVNSLKARNNLEKTREKTLLMKIVNDFRVWDTDIRPEN